jgi:uncharacterized membrane protein
VTSEPSPEARPAPASRRRIPRGSEEFTRVLTFSDGLFAIAMTLLVVGIAVPTLKIADDEGELLRALGDLESSFVSFFISFAVIGRYWIAHHQFFGMLRTLDYGLIWLNLLYLAFVAFLPFPTALLGAYFENPISIVLYAVSVAIVSGLEVVLFRHAHDRGLLVRQPPRDVYRWGTALSLSPVVFFLGSIPLAFVDTTLAALFWLAAVPAQAVMGRWKPAGVDEYFS